MAAAEHPAPTLTDSQFADLMTGPDSTDIWRRYQDPDSDSTITSRIVTIKPQVTQSNSILAW